MTSTALYGQAAGRHVTPIGLTFLDADAPSSDWHQQAEQQQQRAEYSLQQCTWPSCNPETHISYTCTGGFNPTCLVLQYPQLPKVYLSDVGDRTFEADGSQQWIVPSSWDYRVVYRFYWTTGQPDKRRMASVYRQTPNQARAQG